MPMIIMIGGQPTTVPSALGEATKKKKKKKKKLGISRDVLASLGRGSSLSAGDTCTCADRG